MKQHNTSIAYTRDVNRKVIPNSHQARVQELNEELQGAKEAVKVGCRRENTLKEEVKGLNRDLQKSLKTQSKLQGEKEERDEEIQELKQRIKRLNSGLQVSDTVRLVSVSNRQARE